MIYSLPFRSDTRGVRVVTNVERNAVDTEMPETCGAGAALFT